MTFRRINSISLLLAILFFVAACGTSKTDDLPFFPGEYPAEANSELGETQMVLSNQALEAKWKIVDQSIVFSELTNKYDQHIMLHLNHIPNRCKCPLRLPKWHYLKQYQLFLNH